MGEENQHANQSWNVHVHILGFNGKMHIHIESKGAYNE